MITKKRFKVTKNWMYTMTTEFIYPENPRKTGYFIGGFSNGGTDGCKIK